MLSSVNSSINPHGKELMFPNGHESRLHFGNHISFHLNSQPLRNLCFYPSSLDNTQNLQHGTFCTLLTQIHLKLIKIESISRKPRWVRDIPKSLILQMGKLRLQGKAAGPSSSINAATLLGAKLGSPRYSNIYTLMMYQYM